MSLKIIETSLPGVLLIQPALFKDPRGFFLETFHQEKYMEKGYVHLAGIFLMGEKSADGNEDTEITKKSKEIMSRLQDGEEFEVLAKEFSQGPGAEEGGDLGMFQIQKLDEGVWFAEIEYHWSRINLIYLEIEAVEVRSKDSNFEVYLLSSYPELPCVIQEDKPLLIWFFLYKIEGETIPFKHQLP